MSSYFRHVSASLVVIALSLLARREFFSRRPVTIEMRLNLAGIRARQEAYKSAHGTYLSTAIQPPLPDASDELTKRRAWTARACDPVKSNSFDCLGFEPSDEYLFFVYTCNAETIGGQSEFTCAALADVDGDGARSVYVLGSNNSGGTTIVAPLPAIASGYQCAVGATAAWEVTECNPGHW